jgi:D-serine deaminase-like pyridoxal phosphate-dependent protein
MTLADLPTPAALLDEARLDHNIATMQARAQALGVAGRELVRGFRWERAAEVIRMALMDSPALQPADGMPALGVSR